MPGKAWRSFEEARQFARALGLKSVSEWHEYRRSGQRPDDIPSNPNKTYASEFKGYGDWLGTGAVASFDRQYRPFEEAREFVRALGLKSVSEWHEYRRSDEKPDDIPSGPGRVYASELKGYGDWLGTGTKRPRDRQYRPFEEAREFVRNLGLKNRDDWAAYCKSGEKPDDIPSGPARVYKSEFKGYGDWLGVVNRWNKHALLALLTDLRPRL